MSLNMNSTFRDVRKSAFHRSQTLVYRNGFAVPRRPTVGIGQDPLLSEQLIQQQISELSSETPYITRGSYQEQGLVEDVIPAYVALDKKVLRFYAYFEEDILCSPKEQHRVCPVVIYYYLEDDSICIFEPRVENSGIPQGERIKRQRLPRNAHGEPYLWKHLNIGMYLEVYGVKYNITQCDAFTKEFMESEGIVLNDPQPMPVDPYSQSRKITLPSHITPSNFDQMQQFIDMDRKVLRFFALLDDADALFADTRAVTIQFYLGDNTVEIREVHEANSGHDPFPILMHRQKLPKTFKATPQNFPSCVLEVSKAEVEEYYTPKDFQTGQTMKLRGRRFLLYDCDGFTKEYYQKNHPDIQMKPSEVPNKTSLVQLRKKEVPPYNGFGSLEDSLQNCLYLIPEPPKKNVLKMLENNNKVLCYSARMESQNPDDDGRLFILSYSLANDMISIYEKPTRNSATLHVFGRRFVLTDADQYVLNYLESNAGQIPHQTLLSIHQKLGVRTENNQAHDQNGDDVAEPSS
ncbi:hypothetical protein CgunFtcFv8_007230 [Champsocephalus gunnari]|uniref:DM10 domain-containing protein n=1 Tax=Champsocephalus gunnari TaxID=52237 RepID=A0AAN8CJ99_CHAGU|nr:hypothetical protein CgunFtcFv8_007230 [Champsocephalus gunnari]